MDLQLDGKRSFVAAASRGIGRGIAQGLAAEGSEVVIVSSDRDRIQEAADEIQKETGAPVHPYVMDLGSREAIASTTDAILDEHGGIDVLVTNAPGPRPGEALGFSDKDLQEALNMNFLSVVRLCNAFVPGMANRGFGRVINLTSTTAKEPDEGMVLSNTARAAVLAYAKTLSREVADRGVTVNSILTGSVLTQRTWDLLEQEHPGSEKDPEEVLEESAATIPVNHYASPEEFARAVVFLASPMASYVNGASLPVDGGWMRAL